MQKKWLGIFIAAWLTTPLFAKEKDFELMCKHAYSHIQIGKQLRQSGVPKEKCGDELEKKITDMAKDPSFLAPLSGIKFDKKLYLFMVIGGTAYSQCEAPKAVSYAEYRATDCNNIHYALR